MGKSQWDVRHTFQLDRVGWMMRVTVAATLATILLGAGWVHLGRGGQSSRRLGP